VIVRLPSALLAAVAALAACVLAPPGARAAAGWHYDPDLAWWATASLETATEYTGSRRKVVPYRTYIRCYTSAAAFEAPLLADGTPFWDARDIIAYYPGRGGTVNLRAGTCARLRQFTGPRPLFSAATASAMATLLHETLHRQGLDDERITECYANEAVKYAAWLAHWNALRVQDDTTWSASERYALRAMDLAFAESARLVAVAYVMPKYRCLDLVRGASWADHRRRQ
jgi:hypothetical protein